MLAILTVGWMLATLAAAECDLFCLECNSSGLCIECIQGMFINSTSNACQFCPDGQYYNPTTSLCESCGSSCIGLCSYQLKCFQCTGSQKFSLAQMKCVSACDTNEIAIQSSQMHGLSVCRLPEYYVYPNSTSILELGTRANPYKNINLVMIEMFNLLSNMNITTYVKLAKSSTHNFYSYNTIINNMKNVIFQPYDTSLKYSSTTEYDLTTRTLINFTESTINILSPTSNFVILSYTSYNTSLYSGLSYETELAMATQNIMLLISNSSVSFTNIRFTDSIKNNNLIAIQPVKLNLNTISFTNIDFKISGTILLSQSSLQLSAINVTVVDFNNNKAGFIFDVNCQTALSDDAKTGEILFDSLNFKSENSTLSNLRTDSFIRFNGSQNFTIQNSNLSLHYNSYEEVNAFDFSDDISCAASDNLTQNIVIQNNAISFNVAESNIYNNIAVSFFGNGARYIYIYIKSNSFMNMQNTVLSPIDIEFYSTGDEFVNSNIFSNCSSTPYMIHIYDNTGLTFDSNTFINCVAQTNGFLYTEAATQITVSNLIITNSTHGGDKASGSILLIDSQANSTLVLTNLSFSQNYWQSSSLELTENVGNIEFMNSTFSNDLVKSMTSYVLISNPHTLTSNNLTFLLINDDNSNSEESALFVFDSIDLSQGNNITLSSVTVTNCTSSFYRLLSVSSTAPTTKFVNLNAISLSSSSYSSQTNLMIFGPLYTTEDVQFVMQNTSFTNLNFEKYGNIIYLKQQTQKPFLLQNSNFQNIIGGRIYVEPDTVDTNTLPAAIDVYNLTVANNDFIDFTFINLQQHSQLTVSTCAFYKNSATFCGTLISITDDNSVANITNCNFNNNNGMTGGILYVDGHSTINVSNSTFYNNFAVSASISYVSNEGSIYFSKCIFNYNHAVSVGLIDIIGSSIESSIESSSIYSNEIVSAADVIKELDDRTHCRYLCFAADTYMTYLNNNRNQLSLTITYALISSIESTIGILTGCSFYNMKDVSIIYSFGSTININSSTVSNITLINHAIIAVSTSLYITNITASEVSNEIGYLSFFVETDQNSNVVLENSSLNSMSISIANCFSSTINMNGVIIVNVTSDQYIMNFYLCTSVTLQNISMSSCATNQAAGMIYFRQSTAESVQDSYFIDSQLFTMIFDNSVLKSFTGNTLNGMYMGLQFVRNSTGTVSNSIITNMIQESLSSQSSSSTSVYQQNVNNDGSGIDIVDSNVTIINMTFSNNEANNGGAISINCNYLISCSNQISGCKFLNNTAINDGGAIHYNSYSPTMSSNTFSNNTAIYGNDIASYSVKVLQIGTNNQMSELLELNDVSSGELLGQNLALALVDVEEDDVMSNVNKGYFKISSVDPTFEVAGQNTVGITNGLGTFTSIQFNASPGKSNVKFKLTSSEIDYQMIKYLDPVKYADQIINVNFRWCMPGEIQIDNICATCVTGTYSVTWNATECLACPDKASCAGKMISLSQGYWRADGNSTDIIECPNQDACLGGYNETSIYPVNCADGYEGILCNECVTTGDTKVNLQKKEDSNISVLMRIMTNYLQILSIALSFNLNFPTYMAQSLSGVKQVGGSSGVLVSFDCLLMQSSLVNKFDNIAFLKITVIGLIPILLIGSAAIGFRLAFILDSFRFRRYLCVTIITIFFLLHPTLTQYCLSIFKCSDIGNGQQRVEIDVKMVCWSSSHLKWILALGSPMLIIYVIGSPIAMILIMFKNRTKLGNPEVIQYILLLYQGLNHSCYYWEFVNTLRKVMLLIIQVFIVDKYKVYKALLGAIIMFICSIMQARLKPYKIGIVSSLEHREMVASILTIYGGLIFVQEDNNLSFLRVTIFFGIVIANLRFILMWIFLTATVYKRYKYFDRFSYWMKRAFCISISEDDENRMCYRTKITTSEGVSYIYKSGNSGSNTKKSQPEHENQTHNNEISYKTSQMFADKDKVVAHTVQHANLNSHTIQNPVMSTDNVSDIHKVMIRGPELLKSNLKEGQTKKKKKKKERLKVFTNENKQKSKLFSFGTKEFKSKASSAFKNSKIYEKEEQIQNWEVLPDENMNVSFDNKMAIVEIPENTHDQHPWSNFKLEKETPDFNEKNIIHSHFQVIN